MNTKQVSLPIEVIVNLLKSLDLQTREEIFKEVFIECDTSSCAMADIMV